MILVSFAQPGFTIMGMNRIDAGTVPMLASPPAPQPLLSESANPMNRMIQGILFWDHQDCGVCTKRESSGCRLGLCSPVTNQLQLEGNRGETWGLREQAPLLPHQDPS